MSKKNNTKDETIVFAKANNVRRHVNNFDKIFSVNIKEPNELNEPDEILDQLTTSFQDYLADVVYYINNIIIEPNRSVKEKIRFINSDNFNTVSIIDYSKSCPQNSYEFKIKFLTFFIKNVINKISKLSDNRTKILSDTPAKCEEEYFQLSKVILDFVRFIDIFKSNGDSYKNIMLQINHHCSFITTKKSDPITINNDIRNIADELEIGIPTAITSTKMPEDFAIDSILKLSYMITTGKTNLNILPKFKYIEGASVKFDLGLLIESLGEAINISSKHNKNSILFRSYCKALPLVYTKRNFSDNENLIIGIYALSYTKFFCNNKYIDKFIDKMIESTDPCNI